MLASDYNAFVSLETLNLQNQPVGRVEVGDNFKLRLAVEFPNVVAGTDIGSAAMSASPLTRA